MVDFLHVSLVSGGHKPLRQQVYPWCSWPQVMPEIRCALRYGSPDPKSPQDYESVAVSPVFSP